MVLMMQQYFYWNVWVMLQVLWHWCLQTWTNVNKHWSFLSLPLQIVQHMLAWKMMRGSWIFLRFVPWILQIGSWCLFWTVLAKITRLSVIRSSAPKDLLWTWMGLISLCSLSASNIILKFLTAAIEVYLIGRSVIKEMSTVFNLWKHTMYR